MQYDAIVIGGGLGGLTAGAVLAKAGKKVLLLEQYARVGGYATTWVRKGTGVEGALHEIDDIGPDSEKRELLKSLGIENEVVFTEIVAPYRVIGKGFDYTVPRKKEELIAYLNRQFPNEREAIEAYFTSILAIKKEVFDISSLSGLRLLKLLLLPVFFPNIMKYGKKTIGEFIDSITQNEQLKLLLLYNFGYYGDDPYDTGMFFFAVAQGSYIDGGGWFVRGGSQRLSDALAKAITDHGGEVRTRSNVSSIKTTNGRVKGVVFEDKDGQHEAEAKVFVNNASPFWAMEALDDKQAVDAKKKAVFENAKIGPTCFGIYMVVKGAKATENSCYDTFFYDGAETLDDTLKNSYGDIEKREFSIADYGTIDSGLSEGDSRVVTLFTMDRYDDWSGLSHEAYEAKKQHFAEVLLERLGKVYPEIKANIISYEAATPLTMERYTKNTKGSIYGFTQSLEQSGRAREKFETILPNLYNASAWGSIGGGYSGVMISGELVAQKALKQINRS